MDVHDEKAKERVLSALADVYSRNILLSTVTQAKSATDLSRQHNIPLSSAYRRIHELTEAGLISIERSVISDDGKRFDLYRSTIRSIKVFFEEGKVLVELVPNEDVISKFARMWSRVKEG